jgi:hypothetical protein
MSDPAVVALATELTDQTRLSDADWNKVETTARALANSLRSRNSACSFIRCRQCQNQDNDASQTILRPRWEARSYLLSSPRLSRIRYEACECPISLISPHYTRRFALEQMFV